MKYNKLYVVGEKFHKTKVFGKEMVENAVQCTNRELSSVPDEL